MERVVDRLKEIENIGLYFSIFPNLEINGFKGPRKLANSRKYIGYIFMNCMRYDIGSEHDQKISREYLDGGFFDRYIEFLKTYTIGKRYA
jgi:hypothetical protein